MDDTDAVARNRDYSAHSFVSQKLQDHLTLLAACREELAPIIVEMADAIIQTIQSGGKLITFGNGGSAADAQHFAAELTGHFVIDREPLPAIALSTDTSALTAIANDFGYSEVFARQARALCSPRDIVIGISTSGNSGNVLNGMLAARQVGASCWALTGGDGGQLGNVADRAIVVPSTVTAHVQEAHITIIHAVCALIDERMKGQSPA